MKKLGDAEAQEIEDIGVEAHGAAPDTLIEQHIDAGATPEHPVYELASPAAIARVEARGAPIEGGIQQLAAPELGTDFSGGQA